VAIAFMITSLSLAFLASRPSKSSVMEGKGATQQEMPVQQGEQAGVPSGAPTE